MRMKLRPPSTHHRTPKGLWRFAAGCAAALVLAACDEPDAHIAGPERAVQGVRRHLTSEAAAQIRSDGLFSLEKPSAPSDRAIISAERAGALALAYVKTYGPSLKTSWEAEHGAPIDLTTLRIGGRVAYAKTPYGDFPAGYHPAFAHAYGPYYLVPVNVGSEPVLLISVAAYATQTGIDRRGFISRPVQSGAEFVSLGLPIDTTAFRRLSAEEAVELVGLSTGARIARIPELVRVAMPNAPASALWKITLDREVGVRSGARGAPARVREVYVGPERGRRLMVRGAGTPRSSKVPALRTGENEDHVELVDVPILEGAAVSFESAVADQGAN